MTATPEPPPIPDRESPVPGLAACVRCGFEARGAMRKLVHARRTRVLCVPCRLNAYGGEAPELTGHVAIYAPETSQAAVAHLARTAHVILHLLGDGGAPDGSEDLDLNFDFDDKGELVVAGAPPRAHADSEDAADALAAGARRVVRALCEGRRLARVLAEDRASRGAETAWRVADGVRTVPLAPSREEVEGWIEGGGTYAGWSPATLAGHLG